MIKDNETLTQQTAPPTISPAERVPILIEITEEDRQNAETYTDNRNCLVCTALKRMGYKHASAGPRVTHPYGYWKPDGSPEIDFVSDEISADLLRWNFGRKKPFYDPEVVGNQIILYPVYG